MQRSIWLIGLLLFQSVSSLILGHYDLLIKQYTIISVFLGCSLARVEMREINPQPWSFVGSLLKKCHDVMCGKFYCESFGLLLLLDHYLLSQDFHEFTFQVL